MEYKLKYRRFKWLPYRTVKVTGHKIEHNALVIFMADGSISRLCNINRIDFKLGQDWVKMTKERMEQEIGQNIKVKGQ